MSTRNQDSRKNSTINEYVIVRGFGDKPAKLTVVSVCSNVIRVVGTDKNSPVGFHADHVFQFDEQIFGNLISAYKKGDKPRLSRLWEQAALYQPAGETS